MVSEPTVLGEPPSQLSLPCTVGEPPSHPQKFDGVNDVPVWAPGFTEP